MVVKAKNDQVVNRGFDVPTKVLTKDRLYFVFAIKRRFGREEYLLMDDAHKIFPFPYPANLFQVVLSSMPNSWKSVTTGWLVKESVESFSEWLDMTNFYENLVDSHPGDDTRKVFDGLLQIANGQIRDAEDAQATTPTAE